MRASKMLISTLKEVPNEAVIDSHILLLRAGLVRKIVSGVYNFMPLGMRVLRKIEDIIRKNMDEAGALEILSSAIQPKELWVESERWFKYGPELIRFKDRGDREFCLGPTHEEIFTDIARNEIKSYKNLPLNIYQIQAKYRDEIRPRFGLLRSREFIMKDAYSFDLDVNGLDKSYEIMKNTYTNIFDEFKLNYKIVLADSGAMGGNGTHQFMALSNTGEATIVYCDKCNYAADQEKAEYKLEPYRVNEKEEELTLVETKGYKSIEEVSSYLKCREKDLAKCLIYYAKDRYVGVLLRGDREVNEVKLANALDVCEFEVRLASDKEIYELGLVKGYLGPINLGLDIVMDSEIKDQKNMTIGANKMDYHYLNANLNRDFNVSLVADIGLASEKDICSCCGNELKSEKGNEIGQIFKLGTRYSAKMNCMYLDETGVNKPMVMGCYGIGVTRVLQSIIDQNRDEFGIVWPINVSPYHVVVIPTNYNDVTIKELADKIYNELKSNGLEVVIDDRDNKPGFKFKDWDLIGLPFSVVVGRDAINGKVELKNRRTNQKELVDADKVYELLNKNINEGLKVR